MGILGIGLSVVPLALIVGIIAGIVMFVRKAGGGEVVPGIGTTRRLFLYGLAFIALMLAASGLTVLISEILNSLTNDDFVRRGSGRTAFGLASIIVGFPIWALLWRTAARSLVEYPTEAGSFGRKLYAYAVTGVAGAVVAGYLASVLRDAIGLERFDPSRLAPVAVWSAIWAIQWRWEASEGQPTEISRSVRRLYVYLSGAYGLAMLAAGVAIALAVWLGVAYDRVFRDQLFVSGPDDLWTSSVRAAAAVAMIGSVWWWFHWHRVSRNDEASELRDIVVHIFGVFGGLVIAVGGAFTALFYVLLWALDRPNASSSAAAHFDTLPPAFAVTFVAVGVWAYHTVIAGSTDRISRLGSNAAHRAYRYLSAGVGLGTLSAGLMVLIAVAIGLLVPSAQDTIGGDRWWGKPLAAALTLLLVGSPLWALQWSRQQTIATSGDLEERSALGRRSYLSLVAGIALLATLISASTILFQVLKAALDGDLSTSVLDGGKWAIGITVTAAVVGVYHWMVLREDRGAMPDTPRAAPQAALAKQVTVVAGPNADALVRELSERLNAAPIKFERSDDPATPQLSGRQIDNIVERARSASGNRLMLIVDGRGVQVIALR